MKTSRLLLIFPALIILYIAIQHRFYFELYPLSSVDPYLYYSYSPGFWAVDLAFWVFSPLMYLKFRKNGEGRLLSLIYMFCLDAASVGLFLTLFCIVYNIDPFHSEYYTYGFVLMFLFIVPIRHLRVSMKLVPYFSVFVISVGVWRMLGGGNIGYFLSAPVAIDMFLIIYCFFFFSLLIDAIPKGGFKWIRKSAPS